MRVRRVAWQCDYPATAEAIQERFDLGRISDRVLTEALRQKRVRLYGRDYDLKAEVAAAKRELVERLYAETRRQLGQGTELERVLFVGGDFARVSQKRHPGFSRVYARVVREGIIRTGDPVRLVT